MNLNRETIKSDIDEEDLVLKQRRVEKPKHQFLSSRSYTIRIGERYNCDIQSNL